MGTYGNSVVIVLGNPANSWISVTRATDTPDFEQSGSGGTHKPARITNLPKKIHTAGEFAAIVLEHAQLTTLEAFRVCVAAGDLSQPYRVLVARALLGVLRAEKVLFVGQNAAVRVALITPIPTENTDGGFLIDTSPVPVLLMDEGKLYLKDNPEPHILYEDMQAFSTWGGSSRKMKHLIREGDERLYYEEKIEKFLDQLTFRVLSPKPYSGKYAGLAGDTGVGGRSGGQYITPVHMGSLARHGYLYVGNSRKFLERLRKLEKVIAHEQANLDRKAGGERMRYTYDTVWEMRKKQSTTIQINEELKNRADKIAEKWRRFHLMNKFLQEHHPAFSGEYLTWIGAFVINNTRCGMKFGSAVTGAQWDKCGAGAVDDLHDISYAEGSLRNYAEDVWFESKK